MPNYTSIDHLLKKKEESISLHKEAEPFTPHAAENYQLQEVVEHQPSEEVKDHIDVRKETVKLSDDLKKMGIQAVDTTKFPSFQSIKLPISDEKVYNGLHAPIYSSLRWLATFALYLLQQSHITLRQIHGKVIRIIRR